MKKILLPLILFLLFIGCRSLVIVTMPLRHPVLSVSKIDSVPTPTPSTDGRSAVSTLTLTLTPTPTPTPTPEGGSTSTKTQEPINYTITIIPTSLSILQNSTDTLRAFVQDNRGNNINGAQVQWTSDNPAIASVNQNGLVTGRDIGTTKVWASYPGSPPKYATVTVRPDGPDGPCNPPCSPPPPPPVDFSFTNGVPYGGPIVPGNW